MKIWKWLEWKSRVNCQQLSPPLWTCSSPHPLPSQKKKASWNLSESSLDFAHIIDQKGLKLSHAYDGSPEEWVHKPVPESAPSWRNLHCCLPSVCGILKSSRYIILSSSFVENEISAVTIASHRVRVGEAIVVKGLWGYIKNWKAFSSQAPQLSGSDMWGNDYAFILMQNEKTTWEDRLLNANHILFYLLKWGSFNH